jgi:isoquinoline 1-oxidoreductase beta subunit
MRRDLFLRTSAAFGAGLALATCARHPATVPDSHPSPEPSATFAPNAWVHVRTDGTVAVIINKSEMGQGVYTGLPMLVAEELDFPFDRVRVQFAPAEDRYADPVFKDMTTGGSTSMADMYPILRGAGAAARAMLIAAAAKQWKVDPAKLTTMDGTVIDASSKRSASYAELAVAASTQTPPKTVKLKDASQFRLIGTSPKRLDIDDKVRAKTVYGIDVVVPGMVYANVLKAPMFGGTVATLDDGAARKVVGVSDVVKISSGVAVVASNTWAAMTGRDALVVTWKNDGPAAHVNTAAMFAAAEKAARGSGAAIAGVHGDVDKAAGKTLEAVYRGPFLAHAAMEPMNATADVRDDAVEVWAPTQVQTRSRDVAMKITAFPAAKVTIHTTFLGGGFGRRLDADYVADAVEVSKAVKKPVKVTWRREDDIKNDYYRPMSVNVVRAKVDGAGRVTAWEHRVGSPSIIRRWAPPLFTKGVDPTSIDSVTPDYYTFENLRTTYADFEPGIPVGFMRAPGANWNTFVTESFVDELAHAAGKDPLAFRLALLGPKGARVRAVLQLAAQKAGWGHPQTAGASQGLAVCAWGGSFAALVAEVSVKGKNVAVHRAVIAADCGTVVHPDIVDAQLTGAINYGIAMAMTAKITFTDGKVDQNNFYDYTVLRMKDAPTIETTVVKSTEKPTGIGELGTPPIAPAIGNAIFKATGKRVRSLPFSDALA